MARKVCHRHGADYMGGRCPDCAELWATERGSDAAARGWECVEIWGPIAVHVMPTSEDHDATPDCWCSPREDDRVWLHRDELDRDGPADPEEAR